MSVSDLDRVPATGSLSTRPLRKRTVFSHPVADELVLYDGDRESAISLNLSAAAVWEACDGRTPVAEIIAMLADSAGAGLDAVAPDVVRVLQELRALGLLCDSADEPFRAEGGS